MSVIWQDGFRYGGADTYRAMDYTLTGTGFSDTAMSARRRGCYGLSLASGRKIGRAVTLTAAHVVAGWAYQVTVSATHEVCAIREGSTTHLSLVIDNSTKTLRAYRGGSGGTLLATADAAFSVTTSAPRYYEVEATIADSSGVFKVWVDDFLAIDYSGDTKNGGSGTIDNLVWAGDTGAVIADLYVIDPDADPSPATRLGASTAVDVLLPTSESTYRDWTAVTGTVDSVIRDQSGITGGTSRIESSNASPELRVTFDALTRSVGAVQSMRLEAICARAGSTGDRTVQVIPTWSDTVYTPAPDASMSSSVENLTTAEVKYQKIVPLTQLTLGTGGAPTVAYWWSGVGMTTRFGGTGTP